MGTCTLISRDTDRVHVNFFIPNVEAHKASKIEKGFVTIRLQSLSNQDFEYWAGRGTLT